jgi:DNA-binding NtrC family response regulator
VRARGAVIEADDLPRELLPVREDRGDRLLGALQQSGGNRAAAARMLGISRATFYRHLEALKGEPATSVRLSVTSKFRNTGRATLWQSS